MIAHPWVVAFSGFVLLMMMSTVVCLMVILTFGSHRLMVVRTFSFLYIVGDWALSLTCVDMRVSLVMLWLLGIEYRISNIT